MSVRASSVMASVFVAAVTTTAAAARAALEDAGCADCLGQRGPKGAPLVVALHGDNAPAYHKKFAQALAPAARARTSRSLRRAVRRRPRLHDRELLAVREMSGRHDAAWLGARIDEAILRYEADPKRVVAVGYSGGATYLGYLPRALAPRALRRRVAHVSRAARSSASRVRPSKYPVLFYLGATDPMMPYTTPLRALPRRLRRAARGRPGEPSAA